MTIKLLMVMDDIRRINIKKDSSIAMLWAAAKRGFELYYAEQDDLFIRDGRAFGKLKPLQVYENYQQWQQLGEPVDMALAEMNVILMRKDPPFDMRFIFSTYIFYVLKMKECWWSINRSLYAIVMRSYLRRCSRIA